MEGSQWQHWGGDCGPRARRYAHFREQRRVLLGKDKVALRLGRKRSYSSGLELPDGGGDASGVSGRTLLYVRQAGGTQRASLFLPLPDSEKYQDLLSNPLSLLKKNTPPSSGISVSLSESLPLPAKQKPTQGSHD